jgi:hypothetical protein
MEGIGMNTEEIYQKELNIKIQRFLTKYDRLIMWESERLKGEKPGDLSFISDAKSLLRIATVLVYLKRYADYFICINRSAEYSYLQITTFGKDTSDNCIEGKKNAFKVMLISALMTREKKKIRGYAEYLQNESGEKLNKLPGDYEAMTGLIIRDFIINDQKSLKENLERFPKIEKGMKPVLNPFFISLMKKDKSKVISAIEDIIQYKIRTYKNDYTVPISIDSIYLISLAMYMGIDLNLGTDFEIKCQQYIPQLCFKEFID